MLSRRWFIVTHPAMLRGFVNQSDRDYFSRPVEVELHRTEVSTRMLYVSDPGRGGITFPVDQNCLRRGHFLTNKQKAAAGL